ncbi:MAG: hypothetical protein WBN87_03315 [Thermoanaerobaculia bacterium]
MQDTKAKAVLLMIAILSVIPTTSMASDNPLAPFDSIVGRWESGDSYHVIEWGVGGKVVFSRSYFVVEGADQLVSEGWWLWHPATKVIQGTAVAVGMPFDLLEMETRFEEGNLVSDLVGVAADGSRQRYRETWEFTDEDHYTWTLYALGDEGETVMMNGKYRRATSQGASAK